MATRPTMTPASIARLRIIGTLRLENGVLEKTR